jgi:coenzyme F420 hydrogenase subunit delta
MDFTPEWLRRPILVLGCGNILFGDDGFGPAVIEYLKENYKIPDKMTILNVGSSAREILFNLVLDEKRPRKVIIVDAVDKGRKPGEIFNIDLDDIPKKKIDDFSMHAVPSSNLLKELRDFCGVEVKVLVCQVEYIPEEVKPGLSETIKNAIPHMCGLIISLEK